MRSSDTTDSSWERAAQELDAEFGGRRLMHCHLLNGQRFSINFDTVSACCSATHTKGTPQICSYADSRLVAEDYFEGLARIIRENQEEDGPCTGCRFLVETSLSEQFTAPFFSEVSIHNFDGCNSACIYCYGSEGTLPVKFEATCDHRTFFSTLLEQGAIRPGETVVPWGGAEPTTLKTFEETCDFFVSNRISQVINTSGIKFSPGIEKALQEGLATVQVSVDSGTEEAFRRVKRNRHYHEVWENIGRYAATGGDVSVKYILLSLNSDLSEIEAFVDRCTAAGVKSVCISADARAIFDRPADVDPITEKELVAAATLYRLATKNGMVASLADIWTPEQRMAIVSSVSAATLGERVAELDERVAALGEEVAASAGREAALKQSVAALEESLSWRVTKPLRAASRLVRGGGARGQNPER